MFKEASEQLAQVGESSYHRLKDRAVQEMLGTVCLRRSSSIPGPRGLPGRGAPQHGPVAPLQGCVAGGEGRSHCTTASSTALAGLKPQIPHSHPALLLQDPNQDLCEEYPRHPVLLEQDWLHLWHSQCTARLSRYSTCLGALGGNSRVTRYTQLHSVSQPRSYLRTACSVFPPGFLLLFPIGFNFKLVKEKISDSMGKAVPPIYSLCLEVTFYLLDKSAFPCVLLELRCS